MKPNASRAGHEAGRPPGEELVEQVRLDVVAAELDGAGHEGSSRSVQRTRSAPTSASTWNTASRSARSVTVTPSTLAETASCTAITIQGSDSPRCTSTRPGGRPRSRSAGVDRTDEVRHQPVRGERPGVRGHHERHHARGVVGEPDRDRDHAGGGRREAQAGGRVGDLAQVDVGVDRRALAAQVLAPSAAAVPSPRRARPPRRTVGRAASGLLGRRDGDLSTVRPRPPRPPTSADRARRRVLDRVPVDVRAQAEVLAQGRPLVLAPEQPAVLQDRHDVVDEDVEPARQVRRHDVEAVGGALLEPGLDLVGDLGRACRRTSGARGRRRGAR